MIRKPQVSGASMPGRPSSANAGTPQATGGDSRERGTSDSVIDGDTLGMLGERHRAIARSGSVNQGKLPGRSVTMQRGPSQETSGSGWDAQRAIMVHEMVLGSLGLRPMFNDFDDDDDF